MCILYSRRFLRRFHAANTSSQSLRLAPRGQNGWNAEVVGVHCHLQLLGGAEQCCAIENSGDNAREIGSGEGGTAQRVEMGKSGMRAGCGSGGSNYSCLRSRCAGSKHLQCSSKCLAISSVTLSCCPFLSKPSSTTSSLEHLQSADTSISSSAKCLNVVTFVNPAAFRLGHASRYGGPSHPTIGPFGRGRHGTWRQEKEQQERGERDVRAVIPTTS
jgi:hypothetical protein